MKLRSSRSKENPPTTPYTGMAAVAPVRPPKEIPAALKEKVDTLHNSVQVLFVSKQIPWIIQAKMAEDGYVTMEDLACRWVSAEKAREEGPKDLQFRDGENGFDKSNSDFSAMRLYQAVVQARSLLHSGKASSLSDGLTRPTTGFNLDALCDRVALEKDWVNQTGQPKPRLEYQGSDSFLKKQFRYCAKGEIGYFAPKHIISALPEEGERPTKSHRKFTVDGFEKEEEEEERANPQTRRQLERMHMVFRNNLTMCTLAFPQFQQFDITKSDLDEWYDWFYGPSIAGRRPPPSEFTLLWSERNAWRQIYQLMAGATGSERTTLEESRHLAYQRRAKRGESPRWSLGGPPRTGELCFSRDPFGRYPKDFFGGTGYGYGPWPPYCSGGGIPLWM